MWKWFQRSIAPWWPLFRKKINCRMVPLNEKMSSQYPTSLCPSLLHPVVIPGSRRETTLKCWLNGGLGQTSNTYWKKKNNYIGCKVYLKIGIYISIKQRKKNNYVMKSLKVPWHKIFFPLKVIQRVVKVSPFSLPAKNKGFVILRGEVCIAL